MDAATVLTFERLLAEISVDPGSTAILRHTSDSRQLNALLPSFAAERRDLFAAYQSVQGRGPARMLRGCDTLAAFVGMETGQATFAGLWRVGASREVSEEELLSFPHLTELMGLGMPADGLQTVFELEPLAPLADWIGKLVIGWPGRGINWWMRAHNHSFPVIAINEENRFLRPLPPWSELALGWRELALLPASWRAAMAQWRGIYFIYDEARKQGYVGSASGEENLLGRWDDYARNRHGNVRMQNCRPDDLRFSILELTAPSLPRAQVEALEHNWMRRLHTRDHGLN